MLSNPKIKFAFASKTVAYSLDDIGESDLVVNSAYWRSQVESESTVDEPSSLGIQIARSPSAIPRPSKRNVTGVPCITSEELPSGKTIASSPFTWRRIFGNKKKGY